MTDYSSSASPDIGGSGSTINNNTTREELLEMLKRAGISDLGSFVKANLDKIVHDDDDSPDDSRHILIHRHFVCVRDSEHMQ